MRLYKPQLDVLRLCAFLMVFGLHSLPRSLAGKPIASQILHFFVSAGGWGVDLFFCLSAYLITTLLIAEREKSGSLDIKAFYIRRALRIWPLYFGFLLVGFGLQFFAPTSRLPADWLLAFCFFVGNLLVAVRGYPADPYALFWSLCVEEQFYFTWPQLLKRRLSLFTVAWTMLAVALLTRIVWAFMDWTIEGVWTNTLARLDPIAIGILLASGWKPMRGWTGIFAGAATMLLAQGFLSILGERYGPPLAYLIAAAGCGLTVSGALDLEIRSGVLAYLGKISFGLYIFHAAVLTALVAYWPVHALAPLLGREAAALTITVMLAIASYELYEKPFLRLKERFAIIKSRPA